MGNSNHSFGKEDIKEGQKRLIKRWVDSFKEYAWSNQVEECWLYRGDSQSHKNAMCLETYYKLVAVQSLSPVWLSLTPRTVAHQASLPLIISWSLPKFMSIASVILSSILILWCSALLLPPIFPSIRDFFNESAVYIRWPKYWSFRFSISPSKEYSGSISLKIDLFDLLVVQGTLRNLLQHHSSKVSILWHSSFFTVQLSQPFMTTG